MGLGDRHLRPGGGWLLTGDGLASPKAPQRRAAVVDLRAPELELRQSMGVLRYWGDRDSMWLLALSLLTAKKSGLDRAMSAPA